MKQTNKKKTMSEWVTDFQGRIHVFLRENAPIEKSSLPKKALAKMLGYSDGSAVSRALTPGTQPPDQFIQRACAKLPGFEGVLDNFFALKHGMPIEDSPITEKEKSKDQLLDEALAEVSEISERIRKLAKEVRRDHGIEDEDDKPDNGQSA